MNTFFTTYLTPGLVVLQLVVTALLAFIQARQSAAQARLKDEILDKINGRYLHSDVAAEKFEHLSTKIELMIEVVKAARH